MCGGVRGWGGAAPGREKQRDSLFIMDTTIFFSYIIPFINSFTYLFLAVLGLCCCSGFSLVVMSRVFSPLAVYGLLTVMASRCGTWDLD